MENFPFQTRPKSTSPLANELRQLPPASTYSMSQHWRNLFWLRNCPGFETVLIRNLLIPRRKSASTSHHTTVRHPCCLYKASISIHTIERRKKNTHTHTHCATLGNQPQLQHASDNIAATDRVCHPLSIHGPLPPPLKGAPPHPPSLCRHYHWH